MHPRNAGQIIGLKARDAMPECVVVSFVGQTDIGHPHVFPESGVEYDWGFLGGAHVVVAVKPGINARHALSAVFDAVTDAPEWTPSAPYPSLIDTERQQLSMIVGTRPLALWHVKRDTDLWNTYFA